MSFEVLRRGTDNLAVGTSRVPDECAECHGDLFTESADRTLEICRYCNIWLHGKVCADKHREGHLAGIMNRGRRREKLNRLKLKKAAEARAKDAAVLGDTDATAEAVDDNDSTAEAVDKPVEDPLDEFFANRPEIDLESVRKDPSSLQKARSFLRTDTSEEENLEQAYECVACGSENCYSDVSLCRFQDKLKLQRVLAEDYLFQVASECCVPLSAELRHNLLEELDTRDCTVKQREARKEGCRKRRRQRHLNVSDGTFSAPHLGAVGSINPELLLAPGATAGYDAFCRTITTTLTNVGGVARLRAKDYKEMAARGQQYREDGASNGVLRTVCLTKLMQAVQKFKSDRSEIVRRSKELVAEFMATVAPGWLEELKWPLEVCRLMHVRYEARLAEAEAMEKLKFGDKEKAPAGSDNDADTETPQVASSSKWIPPHRRNVAAGSSGDAVTQAVPCAGGARTPAEKPSAEELKAEVKDNLKKAWQDKEYVVTMKRVKAGEKVDVDGKGEVVLTVWSMNEKSRKMHHDRKNRLRSTYVSTSKVVEGKRVVVPSAHAKVKQEVLGIEGVAGSGSSFVRELHEAEARASGIRTTEAEAQELTSAELEEALANEREREEELRVKDRKEELELYDHGTWKCRWCFTAVSPKQTNCPGWIKIHNPEAKYGSAQFQRCGGSQAESWGGYVRKDDKAGSRIQTSRMREWWPEWRGKYSGGSRSQRVRAKEPLTEAELKGEVPEDPARAEVVAKTLDAKQKVRMAAFRQKNARAERTRLEVEADPHAWRCAHCVATVTDEDGVEVKRDVKNFGIMGKCFKCNRFRPSPESWARFRWFCPECSRMDYTMPGDASRCRDCGYKADWEKDAYFEMPFLQTVTAGAPGAQRKKRKRGGKKVKKAAPAWQGGTWVQQPNDQDQAAQERVQTPSDDETSDEAPVPPWHVKRGKVVSGGRGVKPGVGVAVFVTLPFVCRTMPVLQPASAIGVGLVALLSLTFRRSYEVMDTVAAAVENTTVDFIGTVGHEASRVVPLIGQLALGVLLTMTLVFLHFFVSKFWRSPKRRP